MVTKYFLKFLQTFSFVVSISKKENSNLKCCQRFLNGSRDLRSSRNQINCSPLETLSLGWIYCWPKTETGSNAETIGNIRECIKKESKIYKHLQ